ncbi:hypothetical protein GOP47_0004400 [Adiantum capillus-veneris]|uniref:Uncharacterized protein n=1 Tax=Adiantum capillus-veneris TaxID=13818 RepID=A0A9D4ZPJ0_ADICA|nr:hypothetical protein GOP47_0004400 [Adiantum capillus-veneris]
MKDQVTRAVERRAWTVQGKAGLCGIPAFAIFADKETDGDVQEVVGTDLRPVYAGYESSKGVTENHVDLDQAPRCRTFNWERLTTLGHRPGLLHLLHPRFLLPRYLSLLQREPPPLTFTISHT